MHVGELVLDRSAQMAKTVDSSMMSHERKQILIFGVGRGADTARRYIQSDTQYDIVGYVVDPQYLNAPVFHDRPVVTIDDATRAFPQEKVCAFVPMGAARMSAQRTEKYQLLKSLGYRFISYVHSSNAGAQHTEIGENCFILENQSLNFDAAIGDNVVMWSGCQIGDRSRVGNNVYTGAHVVINGDVEIGEGSYLGSNCTISHGVHIGARSFIGANALISQDTKEGSVYVVNPTPPVEIDSARFMKLLRNPL